MDIVHGREFVILLPEKLGEMLKEKTVETGYLPDELDVDRGPSDALPIS